MGSPEASTATSHVHVEARPDRPTVLVITVLALVLLCYTTIRACTVSFSWDEAYTFMHHVRKGVFYQDAFDKMGGNHHLMNVWLMWASMKALGTSELALRLPNLLAHVCFLYAMGRIALKARSRWLAVAAFLLLNAHPYVLDFFSLARGYGLAMGFMMLSVWCIWCWLEERTARRWLLRATAFATLAAMAHVIMINYLLALDLVVGGWITLSTQRSMLKSALMDVARVGGLSAVGLCIILPNAIGLFNGGSLNFGCDTAYWCMLETLGRKVLYHMPYAEHALPIMTCFILGIVVVFLFTLLRFLRNRTGHKSAPAAFVFLLIVTCMFSFLVQHKLFGVPWPQTRTALFLVPLLAALLVGSLLAWPRPGLAIAGVTALFCVPALYHQTKSINTTYAVEWKPSGELRHMLDLLEADRLPQTKDLPVASLGISFESWGSLDYYTFVRSLTWLNADVREVPNAFVPSDYYIVEWDGQDQVDTTNWSILFHSVATNTSLYRDERSRALWMEELHASVRDMESTTLMGSTADDHVSGVRCVRLDAAVHSIDPLEWIVPEGGSNGPLLLTGSAMVKQPNDSNWVAVRLQALRNGSVIHSRFSGSIKQTPRFGEWAKVAIALRVDSGCAGGDRITFEVLPYHRSPSILVDDMELRVVR